MAYYNQPPVLLDKHNYETWKKHAIRILEMEGLVYWINSDTQPEVPEILNPSYQDFVNLQLRSRTAGILKSMCIPELEDEVEEERDPAKIWAHFAKYNPNPNAELKVSQCHKTPVITVEISGGSVDLTPSNKQELSPEDNHCEVSDKNDTKNHNIQTTNLKEENENLSLKDKIFESPSKNESIRKSIQTAELNDKGHNLSLKGKGIGSCSKSKTKNQSVEITKRSEKCENLLPNDKVFEELDKCEITNQIINETFENCQQTIFETLETKEGESVNKNQTTKSKETSIIILSNETIIPEKQWEAETHSKCKKRGKKGSTKEKQNSSSTNAKLSNSKIQKKCISHYVFPLSHISFSRNIGLIISKQDKPISGEEPNLMEPYPEFQKQLLSSIPAEILSCGAIWKSNAIWPGGGIKFPNQPSGSKENRLWMFIPSICASINLSTFSFSATNDVSSKSPILDKSSSYCVKIHQKKNSH